MDTTSLLIIGQLILLLLAGLVFLGLYARKQKKAVSELQNLLLEYKEEMSGDNMTRYFQLSIDDTTAHSAQDTVALKPEAAPDQMAISLRYHALAAELSLIQTYNGELSPWKSAIEPYTELAAKFHDYIAKVPESVKAELIPKIDNLENQLAEARSQYEQAKNQLDSYHQLDAVYKEAASDEVNKQQLEIQLHHALLALAEGLENAAALREVIYLMHEGYLNAKDTDRSEPLPMEPAPGDEGEAESAGEPALSDEDAQAMHDLIEKFTEESAELVEKIYMLNNENKMLTSENDDLKKQIKAYTEQDDIDETSAPIIAGLKMKINNQLEEIMHLQSSFKQLEDKYLALYADKMDADDMNRESQGITAQPETDDPEEDAIDDNAGDDNDGAAALDTDIDTDLGTDTLLETEQNTEQQVEQPIQEPTQKTEQQDDINDELDEIDFAEADTITNNDDVDDILASAGTAAEPASADPEETNQNQADTSSSDDKKPEEDLPEEDEAIDPDAILAEMDEITSITESDKPKQ